MTLKMSLSVFLYCLWAWGASACLTERERSGEHTIYRRQGPGGDGNGTFLPVSTTDRFAGGSNPPRGVGSQPGGGPTVSSIMSVAEVRSASQALARRFRDVELFDAPERTYNNATFSGLRVGGRLGKGGKPGDYKGYSVLLFAAAHARERGGPDHLLYFVSDLLWAREEKKGLTYGGVRYTAKQVVNALDLGLVVIPVANPDGVAYDQQTNSCWRKNRNPKSATAGDEASVGVDLNRNYDVAWDVDKYMAPEAVGTDPQFDTRSPSSQVYHGTAAFSEPETRNVRWVLDTHPNVGWMADLHSVAGMVIHGWCFDTIQSDDRDMNWRNPAYDGKRGVLPDRPGFEYREYMDQGDWDALSLTADRIAGGMNNAGLQSFPSWEAMHGVGPSTGCSVDHAYSRHLVDRSKNKVFGFGIEFGYGNNAAAEQGFCPFYPDQEEFDATRYTVGAGLMELLLQADKRK
ncbi:hypothetical protein RB594_008118 [Gaeumannomyces avenae]